jgi:hypothetical protein
MPYCNYMDGTEYMPQNNGEKLTQLPVTNEEQGFICSKHNGRDL